MVDSQERPALEKLAALSWVRIPVAVARRTPRLAFLLVDGAYLLDWPKVGAVVPAAAFTLGLVAGWWHFGPGDTYTFSIALMAMMLVMASLGAALGAWLCVGYAAGDVVLGGHLSAAMALEQLVRIGLSLLLSYILLALLLLWVPLTSRVLGKRGLSLLQPTSAGRTILAAALGAILQAALTWIWVHAVPTLIRPLYTWRQTSPPVAAIQPLQEDGWILVAVAAAGAVLRVALEHYGPKRPAGLQPLQRVRASMPIRTARPKPWPAAARISLQAIFFTFLLAGLLESWLDAALLAVAFAAILLGRQSAPRWLAGWDRTVARLPLVIRMAAAVGLSYLISWLLLTWTWQYTSTFRPVLASIVLSLMIFVLVTPESRRRAAEPMRAGAV